MRSPLFYSHFYWRVSQAEEQETKYFKVWYGKVILLNSFFIRLIWKWINMYLITWNNLLYYRSALVYTVFYPSGKSNFWQICARSDVIFQSKKDLHVLFSINNTYIRNRIWTRKFVFLKKTWLSYLQSFIRNTYHYKKSGLDKFPKFMCVCNDGKHSAWWLQILTWCICWFKKKSLTPMTITWPA